MGTIKLWDAPSSDQATFESTVEWKAHESSINGMIFLGGTNYRQIVTASDDRTVRGWNLK